MSIMGGSIFDICRHLKSRKIEGSWSERVRLKMYPDMFTGKPRRWGEWLGDGRTYTNPRAMKVAKDETMVYE
jgi:hypothetical protein